MDLPQLEYFRVLGQLQHVTRAAEQLGIAQPTLSRAIARLEDELGVPLFHRIGRSIGLSPYGSLFLGSVERALDELRGGAQRLTEMSGAEGGTVAVGVLRSLAPQFVPDLTRRFLTVSPAARFIFTDDSRDRLNDALCAGRVALCLTVRPDDKRVEWRAIAQQELVAIVPRDHRLAARAHIALTDLRGERLVTFKDGYPIRKQIETVLRAASVVLDVVSESDESASIRGLVAAGAGVAIVPRSGASGDVITLRIDDEGVARAVGIAWVPGRYLSAAETAFRSFVLATLPVGRDAVMLSVLSRQSFLAGALAAASAASAGAQTLTALRCSSAPDDDVSSFLQARDAGLFRKAGLDVTIDRANSGAAVAAAVAGGSIDIGKSSIVSLIAAHQRGLPFIIIAPAAVYDGDHPDVAMIVAKDQTLHAARDLVGRVIAVPALGDLYSIASAAFIDAAGGAWKDTKFLEMPSASAPAAIAGHRVDAATLATPALSVALAEGKVRVLGHPFSAIAKHFLRAAWFTTKDYAAKNPETVQRFRRALETAAAAVNANPGTSVAALASFTGQDPQIIAHMPRALAGTTLDKKLVQPTIDAAFRYGAIATAFEAGDLLLAGPA